MTGDAWLTVHDAQMAFGLSESMITDLALAGQILGRMDGEVLLVNADELRAWLAHREAVMRESAPRGFP